MNNIHNNEMRTIITIMRGAVGGVNCNDYEFIGEIRRWFKVNKSGRRKEREHVCEPGWCEHLSLQLTRLAQPPFNSLLPSSDQLLSPPARTGDTPPMATWKPLARPALPS